MTAATGFFVTGTDTHVGKTRVSAALAKSWRAAGQRVGVYKPVASGCVVNPCGQAISDDAQQLWEAAGRPLTLGQVCPQTFVAPLAPYLAAAAQGSKVDQGLLLTGLRPWQESSDVVLVEGAGGILSPLSASWTNLDLAMQIGWPLVIVAANRIGVMNQVLLAIQAARSLAPKLKIAGVILSQTTPLDRHRDPSVEQNLAELQRWSRVPILGELAFGAEEITFFGPAL